MDYIHKIESRKIAAAVRAAMQNVGISPARDHDGVAALAVALTRARTNNLEDANDVKNRLNSLSKPSRARMLEMLTPTYIERLPRGTREVVEA